MAYDPVTFPLARDGRVIDPRHLFVETDGADGRRHRELPMAVFDSVMGVGPGGSAQLTFTGTPDEDADRLYNQDEARAVDELSTSWPVDAALTTGPSTVMDVIVAAGAISTTGHGDSVVTIAMDGDHVWTVATDPATHAPLAASQSIADSGIADRPPGIASAQPRDFLGVCYSQGTGPAGGSGGSDGVSFALVDPLGQRIGQPVEIVSGLTNIGGCEVAWNGRDFLVAWWSACCNAVINNVFVRRVRPRL